jgi:tetratricopeptide (TPR) repeat protein
VTEIDSDTDKPAAPVQHSVRVKSDQLASLVAQSVQRGIAHRQLAEQQAAALGIADLDMALIQYESERHAKSEATRLLQQGSYIEAEAVLRELLAHLPDHAAGQLMLGLALQGQNRMADAEAAYQGAIAAGQTTVEAYSRLGFVRALQAKYDAAVDSYESAVALDKNAVTYRNLGAALEMQGRQEEAITALREALTLDPTAVDIAVNLATLLLKTQRLDEAQQQLERVLTQQPDEANVYHRLGQVQAARNDFEAAVLSYRRAVALDAGHTAAHRDLAAANRQYEAEGVIAQSCVHDSDTTGTASGAKSRRGTRPLSFRPAARKPGAQQRAASPAAPPLAACLQQAEALCAQQRIDEAEACYRQALATYPQSAALHAGLGMVYCLQRRFADAAHSCRTAARLEPRYVGAHCHLGVALAGLLHRRRRRQAFAPRWSWIRFRSSRAPIWPICSTSRIAI